MSRHHKLNNSLYVLKVDQSKKRPNLSASKTPASAKKAKNTTPEKTGEAIIHTLFVFILIFPSALPF